ncbi:unnamed protein product [Rotaria sp. Silwood1]|nr:unnamed protein product [Rotaria sp. Silwood1]
MWGNKFVSYWFIWNESTTEPRTLQNNINFVYSGGSLSWTKGIELLVSHLVEINKSCDYIFTHDDDLIFRIKQQFYVSEVSLPNLLINTLKTYRPAIASFPWSTADKTVLAMKELASIYENEIIAPLTGFDNGMVIYHKSIVNYFIPFSPRGEGGFKSEWTLCAHFLQMFANLLFGKYAIRLNMFEYNNSINMDNKLPGNHFKERIQIKNGLAYVHNSRHPYEYPQNEAYKSFLSDGLKFPYQSWGRTLNTEHRLETLKVTDPKRKSFDGLWLLKRLNEVYDIRHEALSRNKLLHDQFTDKQKLSVLQETNFSLKLILLTMNRPLSFQRLWKSITNTLSINRTIDIFIHVDMDQDDDRRRRYLEYLSSLRTRHGDVHIIAYSARRGLKTIMMEAWRPLSNDEYAIFIEDDIALSPYFLLYIEKLVKAYFYDLKLDRRLFGISLYNQRYNEVLENYVNVPNDYQLYVYQMPQSWGALYAPRMWRHFLKFLSNKLDPFIPDSYTNRWPPEKIANTTKQGPVVIDAWTKPYNFGGLWKRSTHMSTRSLCLNKFVEIFGGMPLKYTTCMFKINRNQTVPGKDKHFYQDQFPME